MKQAVHSFDAYITKLVSIIFGNWARPIFIVASSIGEPVVVLLIASVMMGVGLYAENAEIVAIGLMVPLTLVLGTFLKTLFERSRPMTDYVAGMRLQTFSFPSGHSSGSTAAYGGLAVLIDGATHHDIMTVVGLIASIIIITVGISRVYLGAHFPSDVIAGWLLGVCSILFMLCIIRPVI